MARNVGYLTSSKTPEAQESYTPYYAVDPIMKYIPKDKKIWCPFDKEWSAFYQSFKQNGYEVVRSHLDDGKDFFTYEPDDYDVIVSNPPYSIKDKIIKRLYELDKPFAILIPLNSLQGKERYESFKNGIQLLAFNERIGFHMQSNMEEPTTGNSFATAYFCKDVLPNDLILEELHKYSKKLASQKGE